MNKINKIKFPHTAYYSIAVLALIIAEIIFYQFYYAVPITINGEKFVAKKNETLHSFLKRKNKVVKYGNLYDIEGKPIPSQVGGEPRVIVNNKAENLNYSIQSDDEIITRKGKNQTEPIAKTQTQEFQSKIVYKGKGAFIYVIKKGRPGIRSLKKGAISNKVVYGDWLVTPQDFTVGLSNIRYRKVVALTFDDGPSKYTSLVMKILKQHKVKGSFFVVGSMINKRSKWLKEMAKRNYTIGNHTFNHISLKKGKTEEIERELLKTDDLILKTSGHRSTWVRPPGGALNSSAINFILKKGYKISLWNIDTLDWKRKSPTFIQDKIISDLKPGQVILMHDGGGNRINTAKALPGIITKIKKAGYRMVSLDDLYRLVE